MPIWVTGMARASNSALAIRRGAAGFSLLELLIAMLIVGLIVSLAGVSVSSGSQSYRIEASLNEFMDIAEYAMEEAQFRGRDMGLLLEQDNENGVQRYTYQWLEPNERGEWVAAGFDPDAFGARELPEGLDVALEIEEGGIPLADEIEADEEATLRPQAVFYSSGEASPGIMTWIDIESGDVLWELEWDLLGRFSKRLKGLEEAADDDF